MHEESIKRLRRITVGELRIGSAERRAIFAVLDSARISEGPMTSRFEDEWSRYVGTKHSVALNSGTSALIAGLTSLRHHSRYRISSGSKVITTPLTYVATSNAFVLSGFEPVYADIDEETFCLSSENVKSLLEEMDDPSDCSVLLPVHLMGYSCDMNIMERIARKYGFVLMEDAAQAHGTLYQRKRVGSLSVLSAFSFYIAHNIQAGELGAINTNDTEIYRLIKKIKANGRMCDCHICTRKTSGCPKMKGSSDDDDSDPRFTHNLKDITSRQQNFKLRLL